MRSERIQIAKDIAALLTSSQFIYFVSYKGLKVADFNVFRSKLAEYKLSGDSSVVVGTDAGAAAKVIDTFSKDTKGVLSAKCGYIEGAMLSDKDVAAIAGLPSKDALRAQLLGLLVAVPTGLVRVLNAKASSIVNVINAYKNKLEQN